jgi:hypothetical protein
MKEVKETDEQWDLVIEGKSSLFDLKFADVWRYRDLLLMFVKRDFVSFYKQTILGCGGCAGDDYDQGINPAFSTREIVERKKQIALDGINKIKHIAYLDFKDGYLNGKPIDNRKRIEEEQCNTYKKIYTKFKNSNLSRLELKNLYTN